MYYQELSEAFLNNFFNKGSAIQTHIQHTPEQAQNLLNFFLTI